MNARRNRAALLLLAAALLAVAGCAVHQHVRYDVEDVAPAPPGPLAQHRVVLRPFVDGRDPTVLARRGTRLRPAIFENDDGKWYVTAEDHYADGTVVESVTRAVAHHLATSRVFADVAVGEPHAGDLVLTATLTRFEAIRQRDEDKEAIANNPFMGLLGLTVALTTAEYHGRTDLVGVSLADADTGRVLWEGDVQGSVDGEERLMNSYWTVYEHANASLKDAVNHLVQQLTLLAL